MWWALLLQEHDFDIQYNTGRKLLHADSLSRNPVNAASAEEIDFPETHLCSFKPISVAPVSETQPSGPLFKSIILALRFKTKHF